MKVHWVADVRCAGTGQKPVDPPPRTSPGRSARRWRWALAVAALAVALVVGLVAGSGSDDDSAQASGPARSTPSETVPSNEAPGVDTSVQDALAEAGVGAALVAQLGQVAGDTGYGLTRGVPLTGDAARGFAVVQITTCREAASGYRSLDDVQASDVASGASEADARTMAVFLRDVFCPAVRPSPEPTPGASTRGTAAEQDGTRGLMSSADRLDATLTAGAVTDCAAATGQPTGEPHAYRLPGGELLCGDFITDGPWDPHFVGLSVVFPQPVSTDQALAVVTSLLPPDARPGTTREGTNASYAAVSGSCLSVLWTSTTIGDSVDRVNPSWGNDPEVTAVLYSDRQTSDGSSSVFDGTVRLATVGVGGHNVGATTSTVTC
ncbi:hypothetical protein [Geodermatophilus sp. SYSU D00696]